MNILRINNRASSGGVLMQVLIYAAFIIIVLAIVQHFLDPIGKYSLSQDNKRISDLATIQHAIDAYYAYHGRYPASSDDYKIISLTDKPVGWGSNWNPYLLPLPKDPSSDRHYAYIVSSDLQAYYLYASINNPNKIDASCQGKCTNAPAGACGDTVVCNYGVTSANVAP